MEKLFPTEKDLIDSGFIFRITDNGGATCDRFTIITSDGDYFGSSGAPFHPQGFFQSGEGIDLQGVEDRIETGEERDIGWVDLPADVRRAVLGRLNDGFADWLASDGKDLPTSRDAVDYSTAGLTGGWRGEALYRTPEGFRIAIQGEYPENDPGPYATFREALIAHLPEPYDLAGPEYHAPSDYLDTDREPKPLWDCEEEPPHPYEVAASRQDGQTSEAAPHWLQIGEARDKEHAREVARAWQEANPDLAPLYRITCGSKADRTFRTLEL